MNGNAQGFISQQITQRSAVIGQQFLDTANNIHTVADQLRKDAVTQKAAELADQAASYAERFGKYLQESDLETFLHDTETFSRSQPWTVAFGGFALGISAARLLKVGARRRMGRVTKKYPPSSSTATAYSS